MNMENILVKMFTKIILMFMKHQYPSLPDTNLGWCKEEMGSFSVPTRFGVIQMANKNLSGILKYMGIYIKTSHGEDSLTSLEYDGRHKTLITFSKTKI